ncbi:MAG TPA: hypothetical protein VF868_00025 [Bacteroidia bacterium]|jgi:hypothetical protein
MNRRIKRLLAWTFFAIGFIILTFFRNYKGNVIPYPWLIYVGGLLCFIVGLILLLKNPKTPDNGLLLTVEKYIKNLKENGDRIKVDLNSCDLKQNDYFEEPDYYKNATEAELMLAADYVYFYNKLKYGRIDKHVYQTIATFTTNYKGKEMTFISPTIGKDKTNLLFKFSIKKDTTIYVDKIDPTKYYFDIDFVYAD